MDKITLDGDSKWILMSTTNNKLDEFFSKKDSKKKKVSLANKTSRTDDKPKKETISKKQVEESDEVNLDVTPSSSSLAGLEKLSFLSISSSSIGSWAEEEEKQEGQPILHTKGRSLSNLKKDTALQEDEPKDITKEDKFTGWKTSQVKPSELNETKEPEQSSSSTTKPAEEKFPTLEETARLSKSERNRKAVTPPTSTPLSTENRNYTTSRPGSKVAGSLRALLLESQQDKVLKQESTFSAEKKQEPKIPTKSEATSDTSSAVDSSNNSAHSQFHSSEPQKETSQRRRKFSGLQAIIEEASKDKQAPKPTNGFTGSQGSKEKSLGSSLSTSNRGSHLDQHQKRAVDSKSKQRAPNVVPASSEERNSASSSDAVRNSNRYSALSDMLQDDTE